MLRLAGMVIALLCTALVSTVGIQERRVRDARERATAAALAATNLAAERDSTRVSAMSSRDAAEILGDSLRLAEKQTVQIAQGRDKLDEALGRERRARLSLGVKVDSFERVASAAMVADATHAFWEAHFKLRQAPYTIAADVEFPEPPDSARIALRIALDRIHVGARLACSAPNEHGVKSASIIASTPPWASVTFDRVEQSPDICASTLERRRHDRRRVELKPFVIGIGRAMTFGGAGSWGIFAGSGITFRI